MFNITLALTLAAMITAEPQAPRGGDVAEGEKTIFVTNKAVNFNGEILPPGNFVISLVNDSIIFSNKNNMVTVKKLAVTPETNDKYYHFPHLVTAKSGINVTLIYYSQDRRYTMIGQEVADYQVKSSGQVDIKRTDKKVAAPKAQGNYESDLAAALKKYEKQVAHCEDVALRRNAKQFDEKLTVCVCPIAQKWKLPPARNLYRKDLFFAQKHHGYSIIIDQQGKVSDCAVWDKKAPANPFHKVYNCDGDGHKAAKQPAPGQGQAQ